MPAAMLEGMVTSQVLLLARGECQRGILSQNEVAVLSMDGYSSPCFYNHVLYHCRRPLPSRRLQVQD